MIVIIIIKSSNLKLDIGCSLLMFNYFSEFYLFLFY